MNSASRIPPSLPGGSIARGARFTITGARLSSNGRSEVTLSNPGSKLKIPVLSETGEKIEALMPEVAPLGKASIVVTAGESASSPFEIEVAAFNPGIFSRNSQGWGPAASVRVAAGGSRSVISFDRPARPLDRVALRITGAGSSRQATAMIGRRPVSGQIVRSKDPGESELQLAIPADAPEGCYVPVYLQATPSRASNIVTLPIRSGPGPCISSPLPLLTSDRIGLAMLSRRRMLDFAHNLEADTDEAAIDFEKKDREPIESPILLLPPLDSCTAYTSSFQSDTVLLNSVSAAFRAHAAAVGLDAGPHFTLMRDQQRRSISRERGGPGFYRSRIGNGGANVPRRAQPLFLQPGEFLLSGEGGKDVGPLQLRIPAPAPFDWNEWRDLAIVDRSLPLTVHWRGASRGDIILILASNVDQLTTASGMCLCAAPPASGRFTIPPSLLANLPPSRENVGTPYDQLFVISIHVDDRNPMHSADVNQSATLSIFINGRFVQYR